MIFLKCAGLVGPKSGNVDFILVFVCFFEVSRVPRVRRGKSATRRQRGSGGGLVGPKSGNVEKVLVLKALFKGSRGPRGPQPN